MIERPSIDDHATLTHLTGEHSEQHQFQQIPHMQILLVAQTCQSKSSLCLLFHKIESAAGLLQAYKHSQPD